MIKYTGQVREMTLCESAKEVGKRWERRKNEEKLEWWGVGVNWII